MGFTSEIILYLALSLELFSHQQSIHKPFTLFQIISRTKKLVYLLGTLFMQEFSRLSKRNALSKFFKLIRFLVCRNKAKDLKELLEKKMSGKKWLTLLS